MISLSKPLESIRYHSPTKKKARFDVSQLSAMNSLANVEKSGKIPSAKFLISSYGMPF